MYILKIKKLSKFHKCMYSFVNFSIIMNRNYSVFKKFPYVNLDPNNYKMIKYYEKNSLKHLHMLNKHLLIVRRIKTCFLYENSKS